ncbi:T9SS type A sorting domain-containing protein [Compostibacter hankyongensis]|uniref:Secretion system C-terminal sorting domain-containing protein n=1 Tax=Compostibacter hankyongensis TaxID=1007089 RepID=A0ABP8FY59_9BACT
MYKKFTSLILLLFCAISVGLGQTATGGKVTATFEESAPKPKVIKAFPNPASSNISFELQHPNNDTRYQIIVYNFLGKKIDAFHLSGNRTRLSLDKYYSGIYIYQLRDLQGNLVESGKFNVIKQ